MSPIYRPDHRGLTACGESSLPCFDRSEPARERQSPLLSQVIRVTPRRHGQEGRRRQGHRGSVLPGSGAQNSCVTASFSLASRVTFRLSRSGVRIPGYSRAFVSYSWVIKPTVRLFSSCIPYLCLENGVFPTCAGLQLLVFSRRALPILLGYMGTVRFLLDYGVVIDRWFLYFAK
ncbi:hypothetical protein H9L39_17440 [Fusarium oxysporum f. sp. albedinis]|nr:hypothetical protein H9L39_17440 [Fusarium oxysporum f. sp. albedinis]